MQGEGETYVGLLASALTELGIVSLTSTQTGRGSQDEPLDLLCVTTFGGSVLMEAVAHMDEEVSADNTKPVLFVQPNYDLLLMQFDPPLVYQLLSFAQIQRLGRVSTFRLTQQSLLRGLSTGLRIEHVLNVLDEYTGQQGIPQNIEYTLRDWVKAYREAQLT